MKKNLLLYGKPIVRESPVGIRLRDLAARLVAWASGFRPAQVRQEIQSRTREKLSTNSILGRLKTKVNR